MSQTCPRCYRIVVRACQSDTETKDCPNLIPPAAPVAWATQLPQQRTAVNDPERDLVGPALVIIATLLVILTATGVIQL